MTNSFPQIDADIAGDFARHRFPIDDAGEPKDLSNSEIDWALFDELPRYAEEPLLTGSDSSVTVGIDPPATDGVAEVVLHTGATAGLEGTVYHRLRVTDSEDRRQTWVGEQELINADSAAELTQ